MARSRSRGDQAAPSYTIQLVARATGLTADALRMWERRYGYPDPARDDRGNRLYSADHIRRLQHVRRAMQSGFKPAEVVGKSEAELERLLGKVARAQLPLRIDAAGEAIIPALLRADGARVRQELRRAALSLGPAAFVTEAASPLVDEIGRLWESGALQVHHEHLASDLIGTQLRLLLSTFEEGAGPMVALTTLAGEQHTLGMWMAAVYLAAHGASVRVLGPDLPTEQIVRAAEALEPRVVALSVSASADLRAAARELSLLLTQLPEQVQLWAGGKSARRVALRNRRLRAIATWADADRALDGLR